PEAQDGQACVRGRKQAGWQVIPQHGSIGAEAQQTLVDEGSPRLVQMHEGKSRGNYHSLPALWASRCAATRRDRIAGLDRPSARSARASISTSPGLPRKSQIMCKRERFVSALITPCPMLLLSAQISPELMW